MKKISREEVERQMRNLISYYMTEEEWDKNNTPLFNSYWFPEIPLEGVSEKDANQKIVDVFYDYHRTPYHINKI